MYGGVFHQGERKDKEFLGKVIGRLGNCEYTQVPPSGRIIWIPLGMSVLVTIAFDRMNPCNFNL